jgi:CTP synthase
VVSELYGGAERIRLRFRHRYEVDPASIARLESHGLVFSGRSPSHPIMQVLELPRDRHPFFLGTQAHPELLSRPLGPEPIFIGLVRAAMEFSGVSVKNDTDAGNLSLGTSDSRGAAISPA